MDWQALAAIVTGLGVIASFVTTWWALRHDRTIAENQAKRSEAAARLNEAYTQRIVDALETIAQDGRHPTALARGTGVRWSLTSESRDTYRLTNSGSATAYNVVIRGHDSLVGPDSVQGGPNLQSGAALVFMAARSLATTDSTITVEWTAEADPDSTRRIWQYPLPEPH